LELGCAAPDPASSWPAVAAAARALKGMKKGKK
ncbi:hypothetical protein HaLaN_32581, partial [Haematococcus lacustris]